MAKLSAVLILIMFWGFSNTGSVQHFMWSACFHGFYAEILYIKGEGQAREKKKKKKEFTFTDML